LHLDAGAALLAALAAWPLGAQSTEPGTGLSRTLAAIAITPLGALMPVGPVMAASRDDAFLVGFRLQYGTRDLPLDRSLTSYGLVTTVQIEGAAVIAATVGYQRGDDDLCAQPSCDAHRLMAGVRYSSNVVTTRPFVRVPFFNQNDATGTAALEFGAGWANRGLGEKQHWTGDVTVPLSLAVGQKMRIVTFATPSVVMAWGTTQRKWSRGQRFLVGGGVTAQEIGQWIGLSGLDVSFAVQRAFSPFGTALGFTVAWAHVP
jgi:hypothetical protein